MILSTTIESEIIFAVIATDSDLPAQPLTFSLNDAPEDASISVDGTFSWTPSFPGIYMFDICVSDGSLSDCKSITVTVNEINVEDQREDSGSPNTAPVLEPLDDISTTTESEIIFAAIATDSDLPAQPLTFSLNGAPEDASISVDGTFSWTPSFPGIYMFDICVSDGSIHTCESVSISVSENVQLPIALADEYHIDEDNELIVAAPGVLDNDYDSEGQPLIAVLISQPQNGSIFLNSDGSFTYLPNTNFYGIDSFTYTAQTVLIKVIQRRSI